MIPTKQNLEAILLKELPELPSTRLLALVDILYSIFTAKNSIEILPKISLRVFSLLFPYASSEKIALYYTSFLDTLAKFHIDTLQRIAAFSAQIEIESGSLHYVEEIASGAAYEYRKDLGNLDKIALNAAHSKGTTTGRFYKGRGLMQITGFYNYRECGKALELDLINEPMLLTDRKAACLSAGWFWSTRNCNSLADVEDIRTITKTINGGYTKLKERTDAYHRNLTMLRKVI